MGDNKKSDTSTYECCGKQFIGATKFKSHVKSDFEIEKVCSKKMFRCHFCNRVIPAHFHGWKRHLNSNETHKRHVKI